MAQVTITLPKTELQNILVTYYQNRLSLAVDSFEYEYSGSGSTLSSITIHLTDDETSGSGSSS